MICVALHTFLSGVLVIEQIERALSVALSTYVPASQNPDLGRALGTPQHPDRVESDHAVEDLIARLATLEDLSGGPMTYSFLGTLVHVDARALAWWLLRRASHTDATTACDNLERFLSASSYRYHVVLVLADTQLADQVSLAEGICLVPYSDVPATAQKEACDLEAKARRAFTLVGQPTAALTSSHEHFKQELDAARSPYDRRQERKPAIEAARALYEAKCCLTLAAGVSPFELAQWMTPDPDVPLPLRSVGRGLNPGPLHSRPIRVQDHQDDLATLHRRLTDVEPKARDTLGVSLHYVDMALGATSMIDATVYLGIGLESLFLDDVAKGELKFRLRVRAAKLLGETPEEAKEIYDLMGRFYDYRSKAVHTGRLLPPKDKSPREWTQEFRDEVFSPIIDLLSQGIRKRISNGPMDWDTVLLR